MYVSYSDTPQELLDDIKLLIVGIADGRRRSWASTKNKTEKKCLDYQVYELNSLLHVLEHMQIRPKSEHVKIRTENG